MKKPASSSSSPVRRRIVTAARAHFLSEGFRKVSMDELAATVGMSKKTLYLHFAGKSELLEAVIDDKLTSVENDLAAVVEHKDMTFNRTLVDLLSRMQFHTSEIQPPFVRDVRMESPELFNRIQERRAKLIQRFFGRLFERGQRTGQVRRDLPVSLMIEVLLGATQAVVNPTKVTELGIPLSECFAAVTSVVLDGILVRGKGRV